MEVLVYGSRKSGTTLLQRLLDGGDDLFVHPSETKIKFYLQLQKKHPTPFSVIDEENIWWYFRAKKKNWDVLEDEIYTTYILENYRSVQSLADYIKLDIEASKAAIGKHKSFPAVWVIKEVSGDTEDILNSFLSTFSKGKILMIVRDPRRIASAVYREKRISGTKISLKRCWAIAKEPYRTVREQFKFIGHPRVMNIYFENLVQETEKQMQEIVGFLNISFSEKFIKPTINGTECVVPSSSRDTKSVFKRDNPLYNNLKMLEYLFILVQSLLNYRFVKAYEKRSLQGIHLNDYSKKSLEQRPLIRPVRHHHS